MEVTTTPPAFMARPGLEVLIAALRTDGWRVIGPTIADGAIIYDEIEHAADLPIGWGDEQSPGRYRLVRRDDDRSFGYVVGPTSWKRYTFPSTVPLWRSRHVDGAVKTETIVPDAARMAFLGVRGCELAGIAVQDRVLRDGPVADADYVARRSANFIVAVQCTVSASTCFCTSMGTGPEISKGYDLALTEVPDGFLVEAGSAAGERVLARLPVVEAPPERRAEAHEAVAAVRRQIGDPVATEGLPERLLTRLDDPGWINVAERCLGCANCTLVCPTCFCTSVSQVSDLDGIESTAERHLDSCFSPAFARVAGGDFRPRHQDRYRQWLTHKFSTWVDQFDSFGCVGCGRCVTWCPVGIDVREELATIAPAPIPVPASTVSAVDRTLPVLAFPTPAVAAPAVAGAEFWPATVTAVRRETVDTVTLQLADLNARLLAAQPGQFVMVEQPAFPAVPVSISRLGGSFLELTIRAAGPATKALTTLGPGAQVSLRGPLGRGWPLHEVARREVILVAGGLGLAPLRPLIEEVLAMPVRPPAVHLFLGARTPGDRLFTADSPGWASDLGAGFKEIVDRAAADWYGRVGIVTHLFDENWDGRDAVAFVCGPERMMQAVATTLSERGVSPERTWVTMERHMECGVGMCGHCQLGRVFVCRDGPVFSLAELGDAFGREGL